jgi:hypothetical protein
MMGICCRLDSILISVHHNGSTGSAREMVIWSHASKLAATSAGDGIVGDVSVASRPALRGTSCPIGGHNIFVTLLTHSIYRE